MKEAIFLSAGVPDAKRGPAYAKTADSVAIAAAVAAVLHVTLGRRPLVWGGHPAITPMVWAAAESLGVQYASWVRLYQTLWFEDEFPEDNERFGNVVFTERGSDFADSLVRMRRRMFTENSYEGAVFIGGMKGILLEWDLLTELQPKARRVPVFSTGGATLELADRIDDPARDLWDNLDYVDLVHRQLGIPMNERRYRSPAEQPRDRAQRLRPAAEF